MPAKAWYFMIIMRSVPAFVQATSILTLLGLKVGYSVLKLLKGVKISYVYKMGESVVVLSNYQHDT